MNKITLFASIFLVSILGFSCSMPLPLSAQTEGQIQYYNHPCGYPDLALNSIRLFFFHRWQAKSAELNDLAREQWIRYHKIEDLNIEKVLVFQSPRQRTLAVVSAKSIDNTMCIVKIKAQLALAYSSDKLNEILGGVIMEPDI